MSWLVEILCTALCLDISIFFAFIFGDDIAGLILWLRLLHFDPFVLGTSLRTSQADLKTKKPPFQAVIDYLVKIYAILISSA